MQAESGMRRDSSIIARGPIALPKVCDKYPLCRRASCDSYSYLAAGVLVNGEHRIGIYASE